ncbi:MAG: translocation/assembly module TamB domain-containing protein [Bacteroidota bacterium]
MRKLFKIIKYLIGSILLLLAIAVLFLISPPGKRFVRNKALVFLRGKLKTEVQIGSVEYTFPKMIGLKNVLFKDQQHDTLLSLEVLRVDIDLLKLLNNRVSVNQLILTNAYANIHRNRIDSDFNFSYIIQAFASKDTVKKTKDTSASPFVFDVGKVRLENIRFTFNDERGGIQLAVGFKGLKIKMKELDPTKMIFRFKSIALEGFSSSLIQDFSLLVSNDTSAPKPISIAADEIDLKEIDFKYASKLTQFLFDIKLRHLLVHPQKLDLTKQIITLNDLLLDTTDAKITIGKQSIVPEKAEEIVDSIDQQNWTIAVGKISLGQVNFIMDNFNYPLIKEAVDYNHLNITSLDFEAKKVAYSAESISGDVQKLSLSERSGLSLKELRTKFYYSDNGAYLRNLYLRTSNSVLQDNLEISYPSIASLKDSIQQLRVKVNLDKTVVGIKDVLLFAPQLRIQEMFRKNAEALVEMDAHFVGSLDSLNVQRIHLRAFSQTEIDLKGTLLGLPDTNKIKYDFTINKLVSSRNDLIPFLPLSLQEKIRIPDAFSIAGMLKGTLIEYQPNLQIQSSDGNAQIKGFLQMSNGKGREKYDLAISTQKLNIGRIIKKDTLLGPITAQLKVKGSSFDLDKMTADINGSVESALLKGYAYRDIFFDGKMDLKQGDLNLVSKDPNAELRLIAHADLRQKKPSFWADLVLENIDFMALKLSEKEMRIKTVLRADILDLNPDYPDGLITAKKSIVSTAAKQYTLDSISISSKPRADSGQMMVLDADFIQATMSGRIPLTQIPAAVQEHINRHYKLAAILDSTKKTKEPIAFSDTIKPIEQRYNLNLLASVHKSPFLETLLPELNGLDTIKLKASVDESTLDLKIDAPQVNYGTQTVQGFSLVVLERDSGLNYNAIVHKYQQGKIQLNQASIEGVVDANLITANVQSEDEKGKKRFEIGASLQKENEQQVLSLREGLMLNYTNWTVAQPNKIVFASQGFYVQNLNLSGNEATINVNSKEPVLNTPITATIKNFLISDIMQMISGDTLFANGVLSGTAEVKQTKTSVLVDADFTISDFSMQNDTIGNITLKATNANNQTIKAELNINGQGNDVLVKGDYYTVVQDGNNFNFDVFLKALNLKTFEGLAQNQIRNSSGFLRGTLNVKGTVDAPKVTGSISTDNLRTRVAQLNAEFKMPQEKVILDESGIHFKQFKILDSSGQAATIDGDILTKNYRDIKLDLNVNAKNWRAMSSAKSDNKLFFGDLLLTTKLSVNGNLRKPDINGSLNILKGTKLTLVLPDRGVELEDQSGVVVFVDKNSKDTNKTQVLNDTLTIAKIAPGSEVNVNITTAEEAEFNVIIDQSTGDFLSVRGKAALNTAIDPGGSFTLNGLYELSDGSYELNYNLIKRKFKIRKGSTIVFAGDPLLAEMNVTAVYQANVAPYDLVERQVPDAAQLVYYRQALPFNVKLMMNGPLMLPQLSFDIELPENNTYRISSEAVQLVQAKLSQLRTDTSELNKQVFALLILKRFITDDPFSSGAGTSTSFTAKQSVSRFLGEQLNQVANQLIRGFDLSVDLSSTEDYTTGERRERTDLSVAASKRLFNDRLKVTIGNNFELEGPQSGNNENSSVIPGNLAVDYNLSADGRYMLRAYRQNEDQGVIQGFVTKTGLNFIVSYDYNKFRNLFLSKRAKEQRRNQRQAQKQSNNEVQK